ncbi:hypothetical protein AB0I28_23005 [Phytomonospora sp. NPDC050363]|uniref:hypothetical protein n=1 Tax=Phytomonospora sp. NPDC050363 TaxID=3155642 RepID=UPI0033F9E847
MTLWTDIAAVGGMLGGAVVIVGGLALWISRLHPAPQPERELTEVSDLVVTVDPTV